MKKNVLVLTIGFLFFSSLTSLDNLNNYEVEHVSVKFLKQMELERMRIKNLIDALIIVESQGNDNAVGDSHMSQPSIGALQIRPIMVREVNRILRLKGVEDSYNLDDRYDRKKSIEMFMIWKEFHHNDSDEEVIARSWNGGPKGNRNPKTLKYWEKVEDVLEGL